MLALNVRKYVSYLFCFLYVGYAYSKVF